MKDDLISRQVAIDALHMHLMYRMGTDSNKKRLDEWINSLPSVQPEIVLCKDCKHYEADLMGNPWGVCCHQDWVIGDCGSHVDEKGWCYRAERRTDDANANT